MSQLFSSLGSFFGSSAAAPVISGASSGLGLLGNLISGISSQKEQNLLTTQQNKIANLTPSQLTSMVTSAEAPINQGLIQDVGNTVQADVASRGLSQAPGIFASEESQALAPYEQQNYQTALSQVMQQLGLPLQYAGVISELLKGKQTNLSPSLALFLKSLQGGTGGGGGTAITNPIQLLNLIQGTSDTPSTGIVSDFGTTPDLDSAGFSS
jgi:hypothetical protein